MASFLPRFISLGYKGKYLDCVKDEGDLKGLIELSGEYALSPKARFEVEKALCSKELVHLKSCYRNKYLRRRSEEDDTIVAIASEPEEDQSKWSCTLFRPQLLQSESELQDIICGEFVFEIVAPSPSEDGGPYYLFSPDQEAEEAQSCLRVSTKTTALSVRNTQAEVQLPRYILLKAENGKYLQYSLGDDNKNYLEFGVDEENYMDASVFVVTTLGDGSIRLRLHQRMGTFLQCDGSTFIQANLWYPEANDTQSQFRPVKLGTSENSIGLRVLFNNRLCKLHPGPVAGLTDVLGATSTQVEAAAVLEYEEAVGNRSIYQINYRMDDAKLYDLAPVTSVTKDVNNESETTQSGELSFTYNDTKTETWGNMNSWGVGVTVEISARIPFIGGTDISTGAEYEGDYQWGEAKETSTEVGTTLELEVPPKSRTQVTMIVSRGTLEVPFSYTQKDTLYNGQAVVTEIDGGVFSGVNTYVSYETTEIK